MLQQIMENALGRVVWPTLRLLITQRMFSRIFSSFGWYLAGLTTNKLDDKVMQDVDRALGLN